MGGRLRYIPDLAPDFQQVAVDTEAAGIVAADTAVAAGIAAAAAVGRMRYTKR